MASKCFKGMSLFTEAGARKYLSQAERARFLAALEVLATPQDRSYCEMVFWTGCRPSEALSLRVEQLDLEEASVALRSLKKRGDLRGRHYRVVPLPRGFAERLDAVHDVGLRQAAGCDAPIWTMSRSTAWRRMHEVMRAAGLSGAKACAKGLRHSLGVTAALNHVPETRIKAWLGHASLATTEIYLDVAAPEDRRLAERMWHADEADAPT
ncbi:MAG: tyrosine-type recombinase/integrase [Pseudomonadota bacterium]